jgi:uncharacterized protein YpmB
VPGTKNQQPSLIELKYKKVKRMRNTLDRRVNAMKKWLLLLGIFILIVVISAIITYIKAEEPVRKAEQQAISIAKEEAGLISVDEFHLYNGEKTFYILQGENQKGIKLIVWIPEKKGKIIVKKASEGISKEQAIKKVMDEIGSNEIISVQLGMEKGIPIWEIHSRTKGNLLNYHTVVFETGEWLKKIENL